MLKRLPPIGTVALEIAEKRKAIGRTQRELAGELGITSATLSKIEKSRYHPSYEMLRRIFEKLHELEEGGVKKTVGDMIGRGKPIGVGVEDSVAKAWEIMDRNDLSQLVVYKGKKIVGSVTDKTIMNKPKAVKVKNIMEASFPEIDVASEVEVCEYLLKHNHAVLVKDEGKIVGIVTPYDLGR